jgi:hypothetical protein
LTFHLVLGLEITSRHHVLAKPSSFDATLPTRPAMVAPPSMIPYFVGTFPKPLCDATLDDFSLRGHLAGPCRVNPLGTTTWPPPYRILREVARPSHESGTCGVTGTVDIGLTIKRPVTSYSDFVSFYAPVHPRREGTAINPVLTKFCLTLASVFSFQPLQRAGTSAEWLLVMQ